MCRLFWLQSISTLSFRSAFVWTVTTSFGWARSIAWATACENDEACSWVCVDPALSGTYSCRPLDPEVLARHSSPMPPSTSRIHNPTSAHCAMPAPGPGSRSNTTICGASMSEARAIGACNSIAARFAAQTIAGTESSRQ